MIVALVLVFWWLVAGVIVVCTMDKHLIAAIGPRHRSVSTDLFYAVMVVLWPVWLLECHDILKHQ